MRLNCTTSMRSGRLRVSPRSKPARLRPSNCAPGGVLSPHSIDQRGQHVLHLGEFVHVLPPRKSASGPAEEARHAVAALPQRNLLAAHAGVVEVHAGRAAVVGHEDQDGVVAQAGFAQELFEPAHVLVDVRDHAEETGHIPRQIREHLTVAVFDEQRPVRRVQRECRRRRGGRRSPGCGSTPSPRRRRRPWSSPNSVCARRCGGRRRRSSRCSSNPEPSRCARRGTTPFPESRGPAGGRGNCRRDATCRKCRCDSPRLRKISAMVGRSRRSRVRPLLTFMAPLARASRPVISCDRVGVHIGATWKSVSRTDSACSRSILGVLRRGCRGTKNRRSPGRRSG